MQHTAYVTAQPLLRHADKRHTRPVRHSPLISRGIARSHTRTGLRCVPHDRGLCLRTNGGEQEMVGRGGLCALGNESAGLRFDASRLNEA